MKRIVLALLLNALFLPAVFANNEQVAVDLSGGPSTDPDKLGHIDPCTSRQYEILYTLPAGYDAVKEFDWYVNNVLTLTVTGGSPFATIKATANSLTIYCKATYVNSSNGAVSGVYTSTSFSPEVNLSALNAITQSGSAIAGSTSPVTFTTSEYSGSYVYSPPTSDFTIEWQLPANWTFSGGSTGTSVTAIPDAITSGNVIATMQFNACAYATSVTLPIVRATPPPSFSSSNPTLTCATTQDYSLNSSPGASSYNYSITGNTGVYFTGTSNLQSLTTTASTVNVTLPSVGGSFFLVASVNYPNGSTSPAADISVSFGVPVLAITVSKVVGNTVFAQTNACAGCTINWTVGGVSGCNSGGGSPEFCEEETTCGVQHIFTAQGTNACGTTNKAQYTENFACSGGPQVVIASVLPNPTQGSMKVSLQNIIVPPGQPQKKAPLIRAIRIVDKSGRIVKKLEYGTGVTEANITTDGLSKDIYILQIFDGSQWTPHEIIVK